jgi:hypothetical protein
MKYEGERASVMIDDRGLMIGEGAVQRAQGMEDCFGEGIDDS